MTYKTTFQDLGLEIEYARLGANALWLATVGALKVKEEISQTNIGAWHGLRAKFGARRLGLSRHLTRSRPRNPTRR